VRALQHAARRAGTKLLVLGAVEAANDAQRKILVDKIVARFGRDLSERRFAVWGLAFKANTDDMREAPSRVIIESLTQLGATISAYDPVAMDEAKRLLGDTPRLTFAGNPLDACDGADALVVVTEWKEFRSPDFDLVRRRMKQPLIFDGRNLYEPDVVRSAGFEHVSIGRR
jgi:UDPglucose 6-dehydrogenase